MLILSIIVSFFEHFLKYKNSKLIVTPKNISNIKVFIFIPLKHKKKTAENNEEKIYIFKRLIYACLLLNCKHIFEIALPLESLHIIRIFKTIKNENDMLKHAI